MLKKIFILTILTLIISTTFIKNHTKKLDEQYQWGDVIRQSIMTDSGTIVTPSHMVYKFRIDNFISFLRECGGFQIW